jgi:hypothetical protein
MAIPPSSDLAHYRVAFFFGPEAADHRPDHVQCVFNVKKRSWKGGVQIAVDVPQDHLMRARERIGYTAWLGRLLQRVAQVDREAVTRRADDLLVQAFCSCVLDLALHTGLAQENQTIAAEAFGAELDRVIDEQPERLTAQIRLELDLEEEPSTCLIRDTPDTKPEGV